jgi:hypothetical protein
VSIRHFLFPSFLRFLFPSNLSSFPFPSPLLPYIVSIRHFLFPSFLRFLFPFNLSSFPLSSLLLPYTVSACFYIFLTHCLFFNFHFFFVDSVFLVRNIG